MTIDDSTFKANHSDVGPPPVPGDFVDPQDSGEFEELGSRKSKSRSKTRMYCFHCNRPEGHSNPYVGTWFYSYFIGLSFGLLHFFGPFRCQCCGRQRLMFRDWAHPKFHVVSARKRAAAPSSRRSR